MSELMELIEEMDFQKHIASTRSLDISFNELANMYEEDELIIEPEYQRLFRWNPEEQSRFIESLILELPVPPIFVIEKENGVYELIDGLQRISSYLNFRGMLKIMNEEEINSDDNLKEEVSDDNLTEDIGLPIIDEDGLKLIGCDIVQKLNGKKFKDLPSILQIKLKRSFIRMEIISKESHKNLKYHMFKRLNKGGDKLSEQEIRNCVVRILDSKFIEFIKEMSKNYDFKNVLSKIDKLQIKKKYDQELVLRYFAQKNSIELYKGNLEEFLTNFMEKIAKEEITFDYVKEKDIFEQTFKVLNEIGEKDIFSTVLYSKNVSNNFVIYYYDAFTMGISKLLQEKKEIRTDVLKNTVNKLKDKGTNEGKELYKKRTGGSSALIFRRDITHRVYLEELSNGK